MDRPLYRTILDALKSFIKDNYKDYLEGDFDGTHMDIDQMFTDFHKELKMTIGDLYYLNYEGN